MTDTSGTTGTTDEPGSASDVIRVLIIDDHHMFVQAITQVLEQQTDLDVVASATTADEGLKLTAMMTPDVAIVDYLLPDGDGATLTTAIRQASPVTKVLILSGSSLARNVVAAVDAGCSGFVTKDRVADDLVAAIRTVHGGEPYIEPRLMTYLLPLVKRSYKHVGDDLTRRELEVLKLLALGLSNQAITEQLVLSVHTVRNHIQNVLEKLHAHSKLEAVAIATHEPRVRPRTLSAVARASAPRPAESP